MVRAGHDVTLFDGEFCPFNVKSADTAVLTYQVPGTILESIPGLYVVAKDVRTAPVRTKLVKNANGARER